MKAEKYEIVREILKCIDDMYELAYYDWNQNIDVIKSYIKDLHTLKETYYEIDNKK